MWVTTTKRNPIGSMYTYKKYIYIYLHIYLEPFCPLFWGSNPPKQGPFQPKQGSFGFQVNIFTNIEHLPLKKKTSTKMYRQNIPFFPCIDPTRDWITNNVFLFFFSKARPRDSFLFRSVLKPPRGHQGGGQILTVPLNSELQQVDFWGGFSGWTIDVGKRVWWNP